ncbi:hypothetical protein ACS86_17775 [Vibrio alginolyticus]|nr:hypothetical protein ACS86_17775 [Vibrio alginolyticus]
MTQKLIKATYTSGIIILLLFTLFCYQWLQPCKSSTPIFLVFPSPSLTFFDRVMSCQRKIAHNDANE